MKLPLALFLVSFIAQAQPNALYYRTDYPLSHLVDGGTSGLAIADLNNDGKLDFVPEPASASTSPSAMATEPSSPSRPSFRPEAA